MTATDPQQAEFADAWIDGEESARRRSAQGLGLSKGAQASGSSLLAVQSGCRLPRHINAGDGVLRFAAIHASTDVATRYEQPVEPDGTRERSPVA